MNEINQHILHAINTLVENKIRSLNYDKTFKGVVLAQNEDGTYQIKHQGQTYHLPNALKTPLQIGQNVWVKIPCGIFREMHICGIVR